MALYKKDNWINPNMYYLFNVNISEYDMKEAGFSLIREYKLLPDDMIMDLAKYSKEERHIRIGKIQRRDQKLSKDIMEAFALVRQMFFETNNLEESDIISIKKDAIFTTKRCEICNIGEFIEFRPKNIYTSYIHLDKTLEFYYSPTKHSVKGLGKTNLEKHENYMTDIINTFCIKMEQETPRHVLEFLTRFVNHYKKREVEVGYYRTYNQRSEFVMKDEPEVFYDEMSQEDIADLDISYNFFNVILKLIKIPL